MEFIEQVGGRPVTVRELCEESEVDQGLSRPGVGRISARWGFWHMSRFARDYRLLFGELPSETLRGARTNG